MRYDEQIVDRVQSANDIVEIISQYLTLKRSGHNYKACCPFHQEKTPSFMVHPAKQIFHCFGCAAGGDVFTFLMKHENMNFPEALRMLADRAGITLPEASFNKTEGPSESERLYEMYRLAADFYQTQYKDPAKGKAARDYFQKRGFPPELAEELKIGWSVDNWKLLFEYLSKKGFSEDLLLKSALIQRSYKGTLYDTFRTRLLFPIANLQGKIVAFGGRLIDNAEGPKYLNSPENPVFHKRRELFGLHLAKKHIDRDRPQMLIVEGYFGWLRLYQHGFKAVAATLGTALTDDHVHVLKRFAEEAVVIYDGDKAGEAASLRGLEVFLEGGMNVKIARLPAGDDPDDFILKNGPEAFRKLLDEARDFFDYKLEILFNRYNRSDSLGIMKIASDFLETFSKIQNPILTDRYLRRLAAAIGVDENSLRTELQKLKSKQQKTPASAVSKPVPAAEPQKAIAAEDEVMIFVLAIEDRNLRRKFLMQYEENDFPATELREIYRSLANLEAQKQEVTWPKILSRVSEAGVRAKLAAYSSMEWTSDQKEKAFEDCTAKLKAKKLEKKLDELRRSIAQAEREGKPDLIGQYTREYQTLWRESKAKSESHPR